MDVPNILSRLVEIWNSTSVLVATEKYNCDPHQYVCITPLRITYTASLLKFSIPLFLWIRHLGLFRHIIISETIYLNTGSTVFSTFTLKERIGQNTLDTLTIII